MNQTPPLPQLSLFDAPPAPAARLPEGFLFAPRANPASDEAEISHIVETIRQAKSAGKSKLLAWAHFEDERVPSALLESPLAKPHTTSNRFVVAHLLSRTLREVESEDGLLWTPLLDRLAAVSFRDLDIRTEVARLDSYVEKQVLPRLADLSDAAEVRGLIEGSQSARLLSALAHSTHEHPVWTEENVRALLAHMPQAAGDLAKNRGLSREMRELLLEHLVLQNLGPYVDGRSRVEVPLDAQYHQLSHRWNNDSVVDQLYAKGVHFSEEQLVRLLEHRHLAPHKDGSTTEYLPFQNRHLVEKHVLLTGSEEAARLYIERAAPSDPRGAVRLLWPTRQHFDVHSRLQATLELKRLLFRVAGRSPVVVEALARDPETRNDPEIRERLRDSRNQDVLSQLLQECSPEEFPALFRAASRSLPDEAAQALENHRELALRVLVRKDVVPLLQAPSQKARLAAIALAPQLPVKRALQRPAARQRP